MQSRKHRPILRQPATCRKPDVSFSPASSRGGAHDSVGCGNDGREEARGKPLAELTGDDLRVVVFHRLPQPLESSVYTTDLSTFPQPEAVLVSLSHTSARLRRARKEPTRRNDPPSSFRLILQLENAGNTTTGIRLLKTPRAKS